jgi:hypothetical protein
MNTEAYQEFVGFRMSPSERALLEALAEREQLSLSALIRALIAREARRRVCGCGGESDAD